VRSVEFHPEADAELVSATQYFERHVENLGLDFILAVRQAYERILEFPDSGRPSAVDSGGPSSEGSLTASSTASSGRASSSSPSPICIDVQATGDHASEEGAAHRRGTPGSLVTGRAWADAQRTNRVLFGVLLPFPPFRLARSSPSPPSPGSRTSMCGSSSVSSSGTNTIRMPQSA
jgi:hypothetical protein